MLKFKDFEAINEKASYELPMRVDSLVKSFTKADSRISVEPWPEIVMKDGFNEKLLGIRLYLGDVLFRINWKERTNEPYIIDIWNAKSDKDVMPKLSLIGNLDLFKLVSSRVVNFITSLAYGRGTKQPQLVEAESKSLGNQPSIVPAPPERTDDVVQPEEEFDDKISIFDELRSLVIMVINSINPSLIITGRGGVGKTHTVTSTMEEFNIEKGSEYVVIKGAATALSMYKALYYNNNKIIIFDDCDSIFKDPDGVNILKAALDSYDEREISWLSKSTYDPSVQEPTESKPVPNRFEFDGRIIFISNMSMDRIDPAIRTRSFVIEINVTEQEMFDIMEKSLPNILPNVDIQTKKEVFDFLKSEYKSADEGGINVRALIKAIKIRLSGAPNWKRLASKYV